MKNCLTCKNSIINQFNENICKITNNKIHPSFLKENWTCEHWEGYTDGPVTQNWTYKEYTVHCSNCGYQKKGMYKSPPRKCPKCKRILERKIILY